MQRIKRPFDFDSLFFKALRLSFRFSKLLTLESPFNPLVINILVVLIETIITTDIAFAVVIKRDFVNRMLNVWALAKK